MIPQVEVDIVKLVWMPVGKQPSLTDFGGENASTWATGAEAVREATAQRTQRTARAEEPWIKVGDTIYDVAQIEKLDEAETEQHIGEDEAMPGDEPWE
jgi:hypothetical protein